MTTAFLREDDDDQSIRAEMPCGCRQFLRVQADEPAEEQVVVELLLQLALAPNREEDLDQQGPQQSRGREGRAAHRRIHRLESRREGREDWIHQRLDGAEQRIAHARSGLRQHTTIRRNHSYDFITVSATC
jgi:hypothetical protein